MEQREPSYSVRASLVAQLVKTPPAVQETWVRFLGWKDPLEKGKATCWEPPQEIPPMTRSCGRDLMSKADQNSRDPLELLEHLLQNQNLSTVYYIMPFTNSSDISRGLSPTTFIWKKSN